MYRLINPEFLKNRKRKHCHLGQVIEPIRRCQVAVKGHVREFVN